MALKSEFTPIACSACFTDAGLRMDAEAIGHEMTTDCPNCGKSGGRKLEKKDFERLAHRFFVWGSFFRCEYGGAPTIQFNEHQKTSITVSPWLSSDIKLFERVLGVGFFDYGPRLWMVGEVEPLKDLQNSDRREGAIKKIIQAYPTLTIGPEHTFYRIRIGPKDPAEVRQYDSPPDEFIGLGRMDSPSLPALYASPDLELCVHECRVAAEDDLYVATLSPRNSLRLLDLSVVLEEKNVTEFESIDMAVHMLFLAGEHAYAITRQIAVSARAAGFDGIVYPSYFSLLRLGAMPFPTIYGISTRRIPHYKGYEQSKSVPNLAEVVEKVGEICPARNN